MPKKRRSPARGVYWSSARQTYVLDVRWKRLRGGRMVVDLPKRAAEASDAALAIRALYDRGEDDAIQRFREGELELGALRSAVRSGDYKPLRRLHGDGPSIEEAVDWLAEEIQDNRKERTITVYTMTAGLLRVRFAGRLLNEIGREELLDWLREEKPRFGRPWSQRRRLQVYVVCKKLWNVAAARVAAEARKKGLEPAPVPNPWDTIDVPKIRPTRVVFLSHDEWRRIRSANEGRQRLALVAVLTLAGLRLQEAGHLRNEIDVDMTQRVIRVQERGGARPWSVKNDKQRTVPICDELFEILETHYRVGYASGTYLYRSVDRDAPYHPSTLMLHVRQAFESAEIVYGREEDDGKTAHTCRHSFATWLLLGAPGVPPTPLHVVADLMGDDPKTVLETYAHLLPMDREGAVRGLDAMLRNGGAA